MPGDNCEKVPKIQYVTWDGGAKAAYILKVEYLVTCELFVKG